MSNWRWTAVTAVVIGALLPNLSAAQSQPPAAPSGQANWVSVVYVPPNNFSFQQVYALLRQHNALEKINEILSPFLFPEQLTIEGDRMWRGEFLLSAEKFQAHGDNLLRVFETRTGITANRNHACRADPDGCGRWAVFLGDIP